MKKAIMFLVLSVAVCSVYSEALNDPSKEEIGVSKRKAGKRERTEEERAEFRKRKYEFMDKFLTNIGIKEEERQKIHTLQEEHRKRMKENHIKSEEARKELTQLQSEGATEEAIDAAIEKIADIQADQLRILVKNRMEMEKILGKEKYELFMNNARKQFNMHRERKVGEGTHSGKKSSEI